MQCGVKSVTQTHNDITLTCYTLQVKCATVSIAIEALHVNERARTVT
jgi:hypothetical protein